MAILENQKRRLAAVFRGGLTRGCWAGLTALLIGAADLRSEPEEFQNSLGMKFQSVSGVPVLFSVWETRVRDWNAFLQESHRLWETDDRPSFAQTDDHPAVNITMTEAREFCSWLTKREQAARLLTGSRSYRLPTHAEWSAAAGMSSPAEFSATGGRDESGRFPWGRAWPPPPGAGNYNRGFIEGAVDDSFKFTAPVGQFDPTPDGLFDLGGNVWEWTVESPAWETTDCSLRGGSWMYWRKQCLESSFVFRVKPGLRAPSIGFRCVLADEAAADDDRQRTIADEVSKRRELIAKPKVAVEEVLAAFSQLGAGRREAATAAAGSGSDAGPSPSTREEAAASGRPFVNSIGIRMLPLPGTRILLGEHEVRTGDFNLYTFENGLPKRGTSGGEISLDDRPVTGVMWSDAVSFCLWLTQTERARGLLPPDASYRLPSLAEWKAAVWDGPPDASGSFHYPWGNTWPPPGDCANVTEPNGLSASGKPGQLLPVKSLRANGAGFFDLVGNAAEWCRDVRIETATERAYCGGSWASSKADDLEDGGACEIPATTARSDVGFRLALDFIPSEKLSLQSRLKADRK